jgi:hypothetical protein
LTGNDYIFDSWTFPHFLSSINISPCFKVLALKTGFDDFAD